MTGGAEIVAEPLSGHPLPARLEPETVSPSFPTSFHTQQPRFFIIIIIIITTTDERLIYALESVQAGKLKKL